MDSSNLSDKANNPLETVQVPTFSTVLLPTVRKGRTPLHPHSRSPPPILRSSISILAAQASLIPSSSDEMVVDEVSATLGQHIPEDFNN